MQEVPTGLHRGFLGEMMCWKIGQDLGKENKAACASLSAVRTHHGTNNPAHINRAVATGAVPVSVLQEFGVHVQQLETDVHNLIFKLSSKDEEKVKGTRKR